MFYNKILQFKEPNYGNLIQEALIPGQALEQLKRSLTNKNGIIKQIHPSQINFEEEDSFFQETSKALTVILKYLNDEKKSLSNPLINEISSLGTELKEILINLRNNNTAINDLTTQMAEKSKELRNLEDKFSSEKETISKKTELEENNVSYKEAYVSYRKQIVTNLLSYQQDLFSETEFKFLIDFEEEINSDKPQTQAFYKSLDLKKSADRDLYDLCVKLETSAGSIKLVEGKLDTIYGLETKFMQAIEDNEQEISDLREKLNEDTIKLQELRKNNAKLEPESKQKKAIIENIEKTYIANNVAKKIYFASKLPLSEQIARG